jgi:hypothetical protein
MTLEVEDNENVSAEAFSNYNSYASPSYRPSRITILDKEKNKKWVNDSVVYNKDVQIPQNPIIKFNRTNVDDSNDREFIANYSHYLENFKKIIEEIFELGWSYEGLSKNIEWNNDLQTAIERCFFDGLVVNTSFCTVEKNGRFWNFTSNDLTNSSGQGVKINESREIIEALIRIPKWNAIGNVDATKGGDKWFQTQFHGKPNCVMFQPVRDRFEIMGASYLLKQIQSACEKVYVRDSELVLIHHGGVERTGFLPNNITATEQEKINNNLERGIRNSGQMIKIISRSNMKIDEIAKIEMQALPNLNFDKVLSDIDSDSPLSQQFMQGKAQTGALGGMAPESNERSDSRVKRIFQKMLSTLIRDVNYVFFGVEGFSEEKTNTNFVMRKPKYDIVFNEPIANENVTGETSDNIDDVKDEEPDAMEKDDVMEKNEGDEKNEKPRVVKATYRNSVDAASYTNTFNIAKNTKAFKNSIHDKFDVFECNLFDVGTLPYPEHGRNVTFTKEMIKKLSERDLAGRTAYLELDHSDDVIGTMQNEGVGYLLVENAIDRKGRDKTLLYVNQKITKEYPHLLNGFDVSPHFVLRKNVLGEEEIVLLNAAIMLYQQSRNAANGLSTKARRKLWK